MNNQLKMPLTAINDNKYSVTVTPHCVTGLGGSIHIAHNRALSGFFVRTIQVICVMAGLNGETFGSVGSMCLSANPVQSCHLLLGGFGDGLKNHHIEPNTMQNLTTNPSVIPSVSIVNNQAKTTSLAVAEFFGKLHKNIIQRIENLDCSPEFASANFSAHVEVIQAGAVARESKYYEMTKNGFVFLVMGFTGKRAAQFKESYINRFDEMENALRGQPQEPLALTNGQHFVVAKDGVVIYHKLLSDRTSNRYLQPRITQSKECQQAQQLLADLQAINSLSGTVNYDQVRAALRQLLIHLNNHQPFSQVKSAVTVLEAIERLFVRMWTMIDESDFRVTMIQHAAAKGQPLTDGNVQTLKNIKAILARQMLRVELPSAFVGGV